jgi:hypothetical protein
MIRRTYATGVAASAAAALLLGALSSGSPAAAAPAAAVTTYRTVSGTALCPAAPAGTDCFTALVNGDFGPARVGASAPVVVQTGHLPGTGPGLPVSLLTGTGGDIAGAGGQQAYHWRVLDQNGQVPTADTQAYFHASAPFTDAGRTAREAIVFPDAGGNARVNFTGTLAAAPVAVIATGRSPYTGPGLPVNLVTSAYSTTGFTVRALDQAGHPIVSGGIRIHYWATNQGATPNTRAGQATLTPDANGRATIPWTVFAKGLPALSVVLTGTSPLTGPSMPVNLLAVTAKSDGVAVRVLDQTGRPVTSQVRIAYYATKAAASVS